MEERTKKHPVSVESYEILSAIRKLRATLRGSNCVEGGGCGGEWDEISVDGAEFLQWPLTGALGGRPGPEGPLSRLARARGPQAGHECLISPLTSISPHESLGPSSYASSKGRFGESSAAIACT